VIKHTSPSGAKQASEEGALAPGHVTIKTVLFVTSTLRGGTGAHLVRLLEHFDRARWNSVVLCHGGRDFDPPPHVPLIDDSIRSPLDHFPLAQWRQLRKLQSLNRTYDPAIVHAFFFWPIMYGRILKRFGIIRHLVENREDQGFIWSENDYRLLRATAWIPDRILCVSDAVREVVLERERAPEHRTVVVRNGVRLPAMQSSAVEGAAARAEFGFRPHHRIVGMVANLQHAVKGANYFIESMPLIVQEVPDARFLVLGEGREKEALQARARELGVGDKVAFAGFRPDAHRFYPIMDVSVLTSLSEGLSITIMESMSFGIPVVVTNVGGNAELVQDGTTGLLVPPKDVPRFAKAVVRVLRDRGLAVEFGRNGRRVVERDFALTRVADRYEQIYREVLCDNGE
jgi:L-malate glycosyltransferase